MSPTAKICKERGFSLLAVFPSYANAAEIFKNANPTAEHAERALRLAAVLRDFAVLRGHAELADGWAAAGLLYRMDIPEKTLAEAGANIGFVQLLSQRGVPPTADPPTASQELGCLLAAIAPLMYIITEMIHTRYSDPRSIKVSAVQKHFSDPGFLPEVSRKHILDGAHALHWEIGAFTSKVLAAVRDNEPSIKAALKHTKK